MTNQEVAKSGLLPIKFDTPGTRSLLYCPDTNFLVVDGPYGDKNNLKRLGGIWPGQPKGWKWFFTLKNLEMLIDQIPFDFIDSSISELAESEMKRIKDLKVIKGAALKDLPISLRIPGVKHKDGFALRNYQKLGVQFSSLVKHGLLLGDVMGLGKCATRCIKVYIENIGNKSIENVWSEYGKKSTLFKDEDGEWLDLKNIKVLGRKDKKAKFQKATRIYREKVKNVISVKLQDGSLLKTGLRHGYFTSKDGWKRADKLKQKEWVLVNKFIPDIKCNNGITKDQAEFLSWQIAEGYEKSKKSENSFSISQKDKSVLKKLEPLFDSFGFKKTKGSGIRDYNDGRYGLLRICSKEYKQWVSEIFPDYLWGALSGEKIIPQKIEDSDLEVARVFLRAYFDGEGCCNKDNIEVSSKSEKIIRSLHYMLRRFGIIGVVCNKTVYTKRWGNSLYWRIYIGGLYAQLFLNEIGFGVKKKQQKLEVLCSKKTNTNVANSIPCRHILKELLKLTDLSDKLSNINTVYVSDKAKPQNPSKELAIKIIETFKDLLENGIPKKKKSKWSPRRAKMRINLVKNKLKIEKLLNELDAMIMDDFVWLKVSEVKKEKYNDYVYDLEIDGEHNYSANMILGHNTVQAIGMALWRKHFHGAKKCLIIAPASIKFNWEEEFGLWTDESFTIIDGTPIKREKQWKEDSFFTVVNPELVVRDFDDVALLREEFDMIVVDEIHMLKSWKSQRSKKIKELKISKNGIKVGLSGTPIDGKLEDLHSIFEFLVPGLFMGRGQFLDKYAIRDEWNSVVGYMHVNEIKEIIEPFFLRRLKEEVAKELPEKIFKNVYVKLSKEERKIYNAIKDGAHEVTEEALAVTTILRARQFCDAPVLVDEYPEFGAKYDTCMELLEEVIQNGHKVLIFSMFEQMVDKLFVEFENNGWKTLKITGKVKKKDRPKIAKSFNEDPIIDICVMDEAGSTGLNFQEASYVFHYDDNWSPAIMKQRTDRAHRITTKHTVNVINFICLDTIEDHVRSKLIDKDSLSAMAIGDNVDQVSAIKAFSARDAIKLL